jgi:hypothetical protein
MNLIVFLVPASFAAESCNKCPCSSNAQGSDDNLMPALFLNLAVVGIQQCFAHISNDQLISQLVLLPMQDVMGVDAFTSSEEAFAADTLFNAYRWVVLVSMEPQGDESKPSCPYPSVIQAVAAVAYQIDHDVTGRSVTTQDG